jgi:hypothetical protein
MDFGFGPGEGLGGVELADVVIVEARDGYKVALDRESFNQARS